MLCVCVSLDLVKDKDLFEKPLTSKIFIKLLVVLESFCVAVLEYISHSTCSERQKQEVK